MKRVVNILLTVAIVVPVVLLFWPFAAWNDAMSLILRVIPSVAGQVLLYRICNLNVVKVLPALLTGAFAAWGTYLYFTSPHWSNTAAEGVAEELKAADQLEWVQRMNSIHNRAAEFVYKEFIYA